MVRDRSTGWILLRHADVMFALHHPEAFSNRVSRHVMIPNGLDPPLHARYHTLIDPCFAPWCRRLAARLVNTLPRGGTCRTDAHTRRAICCLSTKMCVYGLATCSESVFGDPDAFRLDREPRLLYGAGVHTCPGTGLARLELEALVQALLPPHVVLQPIAGRPPQLVVPPVGGWRRVWPRHVTRPD